MSLHFLVAANRKVDLEIFAVIAHQLGVDHLRLVDILVVVVVLDQRQGLFDRRVQSKCGSDPIMNELNHPGL